jgi:Holliday junction resolvase RusA-like endonuclease
MSKPKKSLPGLWDADAPGFDPFQQARPEPPKSQVMPVSEYRQHVKKAKKKETDYDKWASIPAVNNQKDGRQIIHGNIPSKSNCYKIITIPTKKEALMFNAADAELMVEWAQQGEWLKLRQMLGDSKKGHASLAKTPVLKQYEKDFFIQCGEYRDKMLDGYFTLEVDVYYPNQRADLDNSLKILLDCLQLVRAIPNDNKCTEIHARKFLDKESPRIEFKIIPAMAD